MAALGDKIATRDSYGKALVELGKKHDNVVVLAAARSASQQVSLPQARYPLHHLLQCSQQDVHLSR